MCVTYNYSIQDIKIIIMHTLYTNYLSHLCPDEIGME